MQGRRKREGREGCPDKKNTISLTVCGIAIKKNWMTNKQGLTDKEMVWLWKYLLCSMFLRGMGALSEGLIQSLRISTGEPQRNMTV